jgi:hypothetical protein
MIKEKSRETNYKSIRETIYLEVNKKGVEVYRYTEIDDDFGNYECNFEFNEEDLEKLNKKEKEELNKFMENLK